MAYTRRNTNKDATWARAWTADAYSDLASIAAILGSEGPRHGDIAYVTDIGIYFLWLDNNTWAPLYLTIPVPPIILGEECNHDEPVFPASLDAIAGETLRKIVQENITRTGTLIAGATGTGFTIALSTSTVTGINVVANGGTGLSTLATGCIPYGNGTSPFQSTTQLTYDGSALLVNKSGAGEQAVVKGYHPSFPSGYFYIGHYSGEAEMGGYTSGGSKVSQIAAGRDSYIIAGYNFGIGTASPGAQLHTTSTVRFANFGAGTATFDASGNISSVSDERLKNIQGNYTGGLKEILAITPIRYKYIYGSGLDTYNTYVGFPAKAVQSYIPEAVGENAEGKLSFSDRPIIATLVNAVKELQDQIDTLKAALNLTPFDRTIAPKTTGKIRRMV